MASVLKFSLLICLVLVAVTEARRFERGFLLGAALGHGHGNDILPFLLLGHRGLRHLGPYLPLLAAANHGHHHHGGFGHYGYG